MSKIAWSLFIYIFFAVTATYGQIIPDLNDNPYYFVEPNSFDPSQIDLLVRSINTKGDWGPPGHASYSERLLGMVKKAHEDLPVMLGYIGLQEDRPMNNPEGYRHFASHAEQIFGLPVQIPPINGFNSSVIGDERWRVVSSKLWTRCRRHFMWWCVGSKTGLHETLLQHKETKSFIRIYNVHNSLNEGQRYDEVRWALSIINPRISNNELAPILLGDFNSIVQFRPDGTIGKEASVLELEKFMHRPLDAAIPKDMKHIYEVNKDMIYVANQSAYPQVAGHLSYLRSHNFSIGRPPDRLSDHWDAIGLSFNIDFPNAKGVAVFEDAEWSGNAFVITSNITDLRTIEMNDKISSFETYGAWKAIAYEHFGSGRAILIERNTNWDVLVDQGFHDNITSIDVFGTSRPGVTVYEHHNYTGKSSFIPWRNPSHVLDLRSIGMNDNVTSIRLHANARAWLYEHKNRGGKSIFLTQDHPNLDALGFNDMATTIQVGR